VAKKRDGEALSRYLDPLIGELEKEGAADSLPFAQSLFLRATIEYRSLLSKDENDYDTFIPVLADLKKADAVFAAAGKTKEMGEVRYFIGLVFANIGEFKSALDYYKPLIAEYRENRSTRYLANLCRSAAVAAKALGDGTAYVDFLSEAVGAYDSYVRLLPSSSSQSARFSEYRPLFDDLIWALIDAGRLDEAWKAAESLRGRVTLQKLRERDRDILGELLPAQKKKLDALQAQEALFVLEAQGQYYSGVARTRDEYTKLLESIRAQREDVYREIRVANPQIADLNSGASISAADFIGKIPADTLVLSYYLGSKRLYAFLLDKEGISGVETGGPGFTRASLAAQVDEYQKKLVDSKDLSRKDYVAPCKALYARLLSPMRERLLKYRHVVFIPMDGLFYIPVQTLINPTSGRFFLDEFEGGVSQAASATILAELLDRPARDYAKLYYGFGDAENAKAVKLEYTRQELNEVFALMGGNGELRLGKEASETRIKAADLTEFKYIHLSCHGLNYGYGEKHYFRVPALLFAQEPGEDSHWTDLEISSKNIRSDCVILSACKTALGKDTEGEGLVGLNQAFLLSGANAVVASLWSVADITTYDLIVNFFKRVRAGASLDESLWTAMKQTRGKLINKDLECRFPDHPKLWGAFVLTGKF
jgi:CHAT domain-containing protein